MLYLDHAASTPPYPEALAANEQVARRLFANPSSAHGPGAEAARTIEAARSAVARLLAAEPRDVIFTSGGTEANALAVLGAARARRQRHLVVSAIEHPSVLRNAEALAAQGFTLTMVAPAPSGLVDAREILAAVTADTALVALMLVNNELGTLQDVAAVGRGLGARFPAGGPASARPHFHVDAVQAAGVVPLSVARLGADSLALSAHKMHGLKGAGALWLAGGSRVLPLWQGGGQERDLRSGTENAGALAGFGAAAERAAGDLMTAAAHLTGLRDRLEEALLQAFPEARLTVAREVPRAPHISSFTFPGCPGEPLLHALESAGVVASAGSACASRHKGPSHVLRAIGTRESDAVLRFSLCRFTTVEEIDAVPAALRTALAQVAPPAGRRARGKFS